MKKHILIGLVIILVLVIALVGVDTNSLISGAPPTSGRTATFTVAAADSLNKLQADFICDGVSDNYEIQLAINALPATGGRIVLLEGSYNINSGIELRSNTTLGGQGVSTLITVGNAVNTLLTADATAYQPVVMVTDATGFEVGQEVGIADTTWNEECIIQSVDGNTITFEDNLAMPVTVANGAHLFTAINGIRTAHNTKRDHGSDNIVIRNLRIDGNKANQQAGLSHGYFQNCIILADSDDCLVEGITVTNSYAHGILVYGGRRDTLRDIKSVNCGYGTRGAAGIELHFHQSGWASEQGESCWLENIYIKDAANFGIYNSGFRDTVMKNILIDGLSDGTYIVAAGIVVYEGDAGLGSPGVIIEDVEIRNCTMGINNYSKNCDHLKIVRPRIYSCTGDRAHDAGIRIASSHVRIDSPYINGGKQRLIFIYSGYVPYPITDVEITNPYLYSDSPDYKIGIEVSGGNTYPIDGIAIRGGYIRGCFYGVRLQQGATSLSNNIIRGVRFEKNNHTGVLVYGSHLVSIVDNVFINNNQGNYANIPSIYLYNSKHCIVEGNLCYDDQGTPTQDWGIVEAGTSDYNMIIGNICYGNSDGQIQVVGVNTINTNNIVE